jgi:hypothetical protein
MSVAEGRGAACPTRQNDCFGSLATRSLATRATSGRPSPLPSPRKVRGEGTRSDATSPYGPLPPDVRGAFVDVIGGRAAIDENEAGVAGGWTILRRQPDVGPFPTPPLACRCGSPALRLPTREVCPSSTRTGTPRQNG